MNIFTSIPKGDSRTWLDDQVTLADGRIADAASWGLAYAVRGPAVLDLTGTPTGRQWSFTLTAGASAALLQGDYVWAAILTKTGERITAVSGTLSVTTDLASATAPFDGRTAAQIALANCEAAMATFNATGGKVKKYEIAGRTMEFQTIGELMQLHAFWQSKVLGEMAANQVANGQGNPRALYTRFRAP